MRYAIALEQKYSKNDILLGYLNIANFGGRTYGIDAAANYYFGVAAKDLSVGQAATLAGIVQNPNIYRSHRSRQRPVNKAPDVHRRRQSALDTMLTPADHPGAVRAPRTGTRDQGRQLCAQPHAGRRQDHAGAVRRGRRSSRSPRRSRPRPRGCGVAGDQAYFCQYVQVHHRERPRLRRDPGRPRPGAAARWPEDLHDARPAGAVRRESPHARERADVGRLHAARLARS